MKKIILTMLVAVLGMTTISQAQLFNYQGVLRNDDNTVVSEETLDIIVDFRDEFSGISLYSESHTTTTNEFGEFNIALLAGTLESGIENDVMTVIQAGNGVYLEISINGTDMGIVELNTVPFASYADDAGSISDTTSTPAPNTLYANSGPIAYGHIGGTSILHDFGITSVATSSVGVYEITCDNSWEGYPVVVATTFNLTSDTEICTYEPVLDGNQITIRVVDENNDPVTSDVSFIIYGIAQ